VTNDWQRYCDKENWHPIADLFPMIEKEELDLLAKDIKLNGLNNPITIFEGKVLDGRNRAKACKQAGVTPSVISFTGSDAIGWVLSQNLQRRNLNSSQRAAIAVEAEELIARLVSEAKERQRLGKELVSDPSLTGQVRDKVAEIFATNGTYVSDVKRIKAEQPSLIPRIKAGSLSIPAAMRILESHAEKNEEPPVLDLVWERISAFVSGESADHPNQALQTLLDSISSGKVFTDAEEQRFEAIVNSLQKISVMTAEFHTKLKRVHSTVRKAA
jgi:ParB-like chromosome segregation protein Spo0J